MRTGLSWAPPYPSAVTCSTTTSPPLERQRANLETLRAQRTTATLPVPAPVRAVVLRYQAPPRVDRQPWVCPQQQRRAGPGQTTAAAPSSPPADSCAAAAGSADSSSLGLCLRNQAGHYWNSDYRMVIWDSLVQAHATLNCLRIGF